ncbi:MAG: arylesterase [Rhodobacteraceae bacterium]|nr:arylesterase [Paracoccaceae bacterium]
MALVARLRSGAYGAIRVLRNLGLALAAGTAMAAAEPVTVAALGDSLTQGYGLPEREGLVPQLQAWLDAQGAEVRLINAGVSGDTTAGGLSRIAWTLTPEVDALIVALGGNDLLRGIDPAVSRRNLDGILAAARDAGVPVLLVGLPAPPNYGADYKAAFDAIYPELAATYGALHVENLLAPLAEAVRNGAGPYDVLQPDGLHPNAEGVRMIVEALGPKVLDLVERVGAPS